MPYVERDIKFDFVDRFIEFVGSFHFDGISFSGGEPFLAYDRVLTYVRAIREAFGSMHYVWVYTNGDHVTEDRLVRLVEAGLNEIRFDVAARDYDLKPVSLALKHVPIVTVEIPSITEDVERVKDLLPRLESMGVRYINLHQLMVNDFNESELLSRGYTVLRDKLYTEWFPVLESESAALEILRHAAENNMGIGINYCSRIYKHLFQGRGFRRRYAPLCRTPNEEVTDTGYLRRLKASGDSDLDGKRVDLLDTEEDSVSVAYYAPWVASATGDAAKESCPNQIMAAYGACVGKSRAAQFVLANQVARLFFQLLFVEQYDIAAAYEEVSALFELRPDERKGIYSELREFHRRFETYEYMPHSL